MISSLYRETLPIQAVTWQPDDKGRSSMANKNLHKAKEAKNDEFYTKYNDIAEEVGRYKRHFKDKIVFCNCDDPEWSKFWQYFETKFEDFGLKKLISTHYNQDGSPSYALIFEGKYRDDGSSDTQKIELVGNGDFKSPECIEFLKESDIVCTNPPFSIAREEYLPLLMEYDKKFLIIGDDNWITYKDIFKLFKDNRIWKGFTHVKSFLQPNGVEKKFGNKSWYTNLDNEVRHKKLILLQDYDINDYIKYYNYEAIDISKQNENGEWKADIRLIPDFYKGYMGVPITFIDKYNPEQFEIIGLGIASSGLDIGVRPYTKEHKEYRTKYDHKGAVDGDLYMVNEENHPIVPYARIIIKRKEVN